MRESKRKFAGQLIMIILTGMITICLAGCGAASSVGLPDGDPVSLDELRALYTGSAEPLRAEDRAYYESNLGELLEADLWTERDMYDACHYLMLPMYYAFYSEDAVFIARFADFFQRFTEDVSGSDRYGFQENNILNQLHFYYLCTQFMNLCQANGYRELIPETLPQMAQDFAADYLLNHESNRGAEPTVILHIENILAGKQYTWDNEREIEDFHRFTLAVLCDLKCLNTLRGEGGGTPF